MRKCDIICANLRQIKQIQKNTKKKITVKHELEPAIIRYMNTEIGIMQSKLINLAHISYDPNDPSTHATGESLALNYKTMFQRLKLNDKHIQQNWVGTAYDGQYENLKVYEHSVRIYNLPSFHRTSHDIPHNLELILSDVVTYSSKYKAHIESNRTIINHFQHKRFAECKNAMTNAHLQPITYKIFSSVSYVSVFVLLLFLMLSFLTNLL